MVQFKDIQEIDELIQDVVDYRSAINEDYRIPIKMYILELQAECMVYESKLKVANKSVTELNEKLHLSEQRTRC